MEQLQTNLAKLGFDCGKADGIFGPLTVRALIEFQHNSGLVTDGICGPKTLRLLERVSGQSGTGPGIVAVREGELLRDPTSETRTHVVIGTFAGTQHIARATTKVLRGSHADVVIADSPDAHQHAKTANSFDARVYIGLTTSESDTVTISSFETERFVSELGRSLALAITEALAPQFTDTPPIAVGSRLPVLRETKMTAVLVDFGSRIPLGAEFRIGELLGTVVATWLETPTPPGH